MPTRAGQRKKSKTGRCSPAEHKALASHRKAEAKYVRKNKQKHGAAARAYYHKNKAKIRAQRRLAKTAKHKAIVAARRRAYGGNRGRPRTC
jgi:hypothetical protein